MYDSTVHSAHYKQYARQYMMQCTVHDTQDSPYTTQYTLYTCTEYSTQPT